MTEPLYLTPQELCHRWKGRVTYGTLANWRADKAGPAYVKLGGRVMYPIKSVVKWEKSRMRGAK
jgi:hypothetical protein